jgi:outer membrane protein
MKRFFLKDVFIVLVSVLVSIVVTYCISSNKEKIGFVRTGILLQKYEGMKTVEIKINEEFKQYKLVFDSLQNQYKYYSDLKVKDKNDMQRFKEISEQINSFNNKIGKQVQQRRTELTSAVIQDINIKVSRYADKHNFTLIFGSTTDGSLLYGDDDKDITNDLLDEINELYRSGK